MTQEDDEATMVNVIKTDSDIYIIDPNGSGRGTSVYLIVGRDEIALIDPGSSFFTNYVLEGIERLNIDPTDITHILLTHVHLDHCGNVGALLPKMSNADVFVHERGVKHLIDPSKLVKSAKQGWGDEATKKVYGGDEIIPVPENRIIAIKEGDIIDLGEGNDLRVIYAPGHASHQVCFLNESRKSLFAGDAAQTYNPLTDRLILNTPPPFNLDLSVKTIERLMDLEIDVLYFAHFGPYIYPKRILKAVLEELDDFGEWVKNEWIKSKNIDEMADKRIDEWVRLIPDADPSFMHQRLRSNIIGYLTYFGLM